ncbi:hypothetical protein OBBRIDRAFT_243682 [Obba rivulosa]|uniref:Uncharacterized protein n=1 Tax=Obba rivulosa TaxID=1052685 RepID=A0A8E2DFV6_9APHY|nr:hypothetical protein OBBRIDRAFT_243682 [Obba rivulosa]
MACRACITTSRMGKLSSSAPACGRCPTRLNRRGGAGAHQTNPMADSSGLVCELHTCVHVFRVVMVAASDPGVAPRSLEDIKLGGVATLTLVQHHQRRPVLQEWWSSGLRTYSRSSTWNSFLWIPVDGKDDGRLRFQHHPIRVYGGGRGRNVVADSVLH